MADGGSYLARMPLEVTFGLCKAPSADRVVVTDIRGDGSSVGDVPAHRVLEIGPDPDTAHRSRMVRCMRMT